MIRGFAETFVELQQRRHEADYDPDAAFSASDAKDLIDRAFWAIHDFDASDQLHQRAFVLFVVLRKRQRGPGA